MMFSIDPDDYTAIECLKKEGREPPCVVNVVQANYSEIFKRFDITRHVNSKAMREVVAFDKNDSDRNFSVTQFTGKIKVVIIKKKKIVSQGCRELLNVLLK